MTVNVLGRSARSEGVHADKAAGGAEIAVPALLHGGFDGDLHGAGSQDLLTILFALLLEHGPAGHGDYACGDAVLGQDVTSLDGGAGGRAGGRGRRGGGGGAGRGGGAGGGRGRGGGEGAGGGRGRA